VTGTIMKNGKGDLQRPSSISSDQWAANWALAFGASQARRSPGGQRLEAEVANSQEAVCGPGTNLMKTTIALETESGSTELVRV